MENTRENVVELLEKMKEEAIKKLKIYCESGHHQEVIEMYTQIGEINNAIWLLTDKQYFNNLWSIYMETED